VRALRGVAQHLANLVNGSVQIVIDIDKRVRPKPLLQFLAGYHFARTLQQNAQNLKRLATELQLYSGFAQFAASRVNLEIVEP
jgi:hypothetical protein